MISRVMYEKDLPQIKEIYTKYYMNEFDEPTFEHTLCGAVVEEEGKIICAANIKTIVEVELITNKAFSSIRRKRALLEIFSIAKYVAMKSGYDQIHAFVQEPIWKRALKIFGFTPTKGDAMVAFIHEERHGEGG